MYKDDGLIAGKNAVLDAINNVDVNKIYIKKGRKDPQLIKVAQEHNIPIVYVDQRYLDKLVPKTNHQGIVASVSPIKFYDLQHLIDKTKSKKTPIILMLDEVQDVNNMGAILRICDAFCVDGIIINKRRSAPINAAVAKVSTGAINHVKICRVTNLKNSINQLKNEGFWIASLDMQGEFEVNNNIYDRPLVVVIGGEDKGITPNIKKECDFNITISMKGHVNSLNVSSAVSILAYEHFINCELN